MIFWEFTSMNAKIQGKDELIKKRPKTLKRGWTVAYDYLTKRRYCLIFQTPPNVTFLRLENNQGSLANQGGIGDSLGHLKVPSLEVIKHYIKLNV